MACPPDVAVYDRLLATTEGSRLASFIQSLGLLWQQRQRDGPQSCHGEARQGEDCVLEVAGELACTGQLNVSKTRRCNLAEVHRTLA